MLNRRRLAAALVGAVAITVPASVSAAPPGPTPGAGGGVLVLQRGSGIATMNVNGSGLRLLTSGSSYGPAWSPDGAKIAYLHRLSSANLDVAVMNADGSGWFNLTNTPAAEFDPEWSPDGTKIAFGSGRNDPSGQSDIFVMNADGFEPSLAHSHFGSRVLALVVAGRDKARVVFGRRHDRRQCRWHESANHCHADDRAAVVAGWQAHRRSLEQSRRPLPDDAQRLAGKAAN